MQLISSSNKQWKKLITHKGSFSASFPLILIILMLTSQSPTECSFSSTNWSISTHPNVTQLSNCPFILTNRLKSDSALLYTVWKRCELFWMMFWKSAWFSSIPLKFLGMEMNFLISRKYFERISSKGGRNCNCCCLKKQNLFIVNNNKRMVLACFFILEFPWYFNRFVM